MVKVTENKHPRSILQFGHHFWCRFDRDNVSIGISYSISIIFKSGDGFNGMGS
jgi:hypothetical protein